MPGRAAPSQASMTPRAPGYPAPSACLGNDGDVPLAAQFFSDSFVSHTNNPMMQTQEGGEQSLRNRQEGYFCKT